MGLKEQFRNLPGAIFNAFGNVPEFVAYSQMTQAYAINTNTTTETTTVYNNIKIMFGTLSQPHILAISVKQYNTKKAEAVIYIPDKNLPFSPKAEDTFLRTNGERWVMIGPTGLTPTDALWIFLVRKLY
jgi:hypothetical protein